MSMNGLSSVGIFAVVWLAVMISAGIHYFLRHTDKLQGPALPIYLIATFLPLLIFAIKEQGWIGLPVAMFAAVMLGWPFLVLRGLRYCKLCGEKNYVVKWWARTRRCTGCGKPLDESKE
jgi:hypothetical protein